MPTTRATELAQVGSLVSADPSASTVTVSGSVVTNAGTAAAPAIVPTGDSNTGLFFPAADTIAFSEGGVEAMRIDSSGRVGIGTSPAVTLHVKSIKTDIGSLGYNILIDEDRAPSADRGSGMAFGIRGDILGGIETGCNAAASTDAYMAFNTVSSGTVAERLRIDSSGNVGIGTTSPSARLFVSSGSAAQYGGFNSNAANGGYLTLESSGVVHGDIGTAAQVVSGGSSSDFGINARGARNLILGTNNTERLRINSSGNVLIGAASTPSASVAGIMLVSPIAASSTFSLGNYTGNATIVSFINGNGVIGSISTSATATAYNTSSDYRLKTNLEPISNGIARLKQLPVYRFNWLSDINGNKVDGFVAHEAQAIVPECVTGEKDAVDSDGNPVYQGIDQSKIVPLLTAALKEAISEIETLKSKVAALEAV